MPPKALHFVFVLTTAGFGALGPRLAQAAVHNATWLGGSGSWGEANRWSDGVVPNNTETDQYEVFIDGGNPQTSNVTVHTVTVDSLTLDSPGGMQVTPNGVFTALKGMTVNGGVTLTGRAAIRVGANGAINGTGRIHSFYTDRDDTITADGGSLTLGTGLTVGISSQPEGGNMTMGGNYPLINNGTISNLHQFALLRAVGTTITNNGVFEIGNGGKIEVTGAIDHLADLGNVTNDGTGALIFAGVYDNAASTLVFDGSVPGLEIGGTVQGGTISATAGNRLVTSRNTLLLDNVTLNAPTMVKGVVHIGAGQTLAGNADIVLENSAAAVGTAGGTFTIAAGINLHGRGNIGAGANVDFAPLINNGHITADVPNTLLKVTGNGITNNGLFEVKNNAILAFGGNLQMSGLGNIVNNGGSLQIGGNLDNAGQTFINGSPHTWSLGSGGRITGGVVQTLPGHDLIVEQVANPTLDGVQLDGTVRFGAATNTALYITNGITGSGTILFAATTPGGNTILNAFWQKSYQPVTVGPGVTIRGGSGTIRELRNYGTVHAESGATISLSGNPSLGGDRNAGTIRISNGGKIISQHLDFDARGELQIELGGPLAQAILAVNGSLDLSSTEDFLTVVQLSGGDGGGALEPYLIATYTGTLTGVFDHVSPGYVVDYSKPNQILVSVPEPSSFLLISAGMTCLLRRRRLPAPGCPHLAG